MSRKSLRGLVVAFATFALVLSGASAAVTFDPATGEGFVGKGDVQQVFGWNNHQLQANADLVEFQVNSVTETTWTCSRPAPIPNDPDRVSTQERSVTTTTQGLVDYIARERTQITGFILTGFDGTSTVETEGPALFSCPNSNSEFTFDEDSVVTTVIGGGGLEVSINGSDWFPIG